MAKSRILENEERHYRLTELAKLLPDEPNDKTVWVWCKGREQRGLLHMDYIASPGGMRSSVEAYHRFIQEFNQ